MGIEYLHFAQDRMFDEDAGCGFAHKPITRNNVKWCAIQRVWVYTRGNDRKSREYYETCAEGTTWPYFFSEYAILMA